MSSVWPRVDAACTSGVCDCFCGCIQLLLSDDASQWDRALQMPHYSAKAMPAVSMDTILHMTQSARTGRFRLFDYGSATDNMSAYGQPVPPDVAEEYWRLGALTVTAAAGTLSRALARSCSLCP